MPTYREVLSSHPDRALAVDCLVAALKKRDGSLAAYFFEAGRNIEAEDNLTEEFWCTFADYLLIALKSSSISEIEQGLTDIFRLYRLNGKLVPIDRKFHGRAVKTSFFADALIQNGLPSTVANEIMAKIPAYSVSEMSRLFYNMELSRFGLMWSTFCEKEDGDDPFYPRYSHASELIDDLGLPFMPGHEYFLLIYSLPYDYQRFFPTIADAYGGGFFFPFRANNGRTHPIRFQDRLNGRPEVVHCSITGKHIAKSVELIRPE